MGRYLQHGRRHSRGGTDPIPGFGTPSVATFYRLGTDAAQSIAATSTANLQWPHQKLPSDGSITAVTLAGTVQELQANKPLLTIEHTYVRWEDAAFKRAVVFGTNSRIITADRYGEANQGDGTAGADGSGKRWVSDFRMNAYVVGDTSKVYVANGDSGARNVVEAWWVIYAWEAIGYDGSIPGYPL